MSTQKERRARRREQTFAVAQRRRDEHLRRNHFDPVSGFTQVDCVCDLADTFFAKQTAFGCACAKRRKGQPKLAGGMCCVEYRDRIYQWRRENRRIRRGLDPAEHQQHWPSTKKGAKPWVIKKRKLDRAGEPLEGWWEFRRYRDARGAEDALRSLRASSKRGGWQGYGFMLIAPGAVFSL